MGDFKLAEVFSENDCIRIEIPNLESIEILNEWLRDHCRCTECYNDFTNQRRISLLEFPSNISPKEYNLLNGVLNVTWIGGHRSQYKLPWLVKYAKYLGDDTIKKTETIPWSKLPKIVRVDSKTYLNTDAGLSQVLSSLLTYGVVMVTDVEPTLLATEQAIARISPVQKTLFGEMWEVKNNADIDIQEESVCDLREENSTNIHKDTAYTDIALGAHTDNTYWCDAAGLQVFHFLKPAPRGGETLLVDGLNVALRLKRDHPETYERLTRVPVSATYIEDGQHHTHVDPIIKLHPVTKEFLQIRFNLYDRSVLRTIPQKEIKQHYNDLRIIASIITDKSGENYLKLSSGEVVFVDNWRVMHGRTSYSGLRHFVGGYVSRTDWRSKATVFGLVDDI